MITQYGFTGPRKITLYHKQVISNTLDELPTFEGAGWEFTTGAAFGVDTFVAVALAYRYPLAHHRVIVPNAPYNTEIHSLMLNAPSPDVEIITMTEGSYRERNQRIIDFSSTLMGFPFTKQEVLRSGTWMTIRMARKQGCPVILTELEPKLDS